MKLRVEKTIKTYYTGVMNEEDSQRVIDNAKRKVFLLKKVYKTLQTTISLSLNHIYMNLTRTSGIIMWMKNTKDKNKSY